MARARTSESHAGPSGRAMPNCSANAVPTSGSRALFGGDPVVTALLELQRELLPARPRDAPINQHVHAIRHDVVEEPLVVRDYKKRVISAPKLVYTIRDRPQRVDVQTGIRLVEYRADRIERGQLQYLVPLLLAAGEAGVDRALEHRLVEVDELQ